MTPHNEVLLCWRNSYQHLQWKLRKWLVAWGWREGLPTDQEQGVSEVRGGWGRGSVISGRQG